MLRAGKRTHRLGFYRGITYRDRCECNKGGRKIADEWKLLGYECYKRGLRERELVGNTSTVVRKKSQSPRPRAPSGPLPDVDLGACAGYVKGGAASASETCKDAAVASTAHHRSSSAQATPTTPRPPRRPRRRRRRAKRNRNRRRSNCRHLGSWHRACRRPTRRSPSPRAASRPSSGSGRRNSSSRSPLLPCRGPSRRKGHKRRRRPGRH